MKDINASEITKSLDNLKQDLEQNYVQIGEVLFSAKAQNFHRMKGYESFGEYVEREHNISRGMASKLMKVYRLYVNEMDESEEDIKEIGLDKLLAIYPVINKINNDVDSEGESEEWMGKARDMSAKELKDAVKERREKDKELDFKDVLTGQVWDKLSNWIGGGNKKKTMYRLACYFNGVNVEELKPTVMEAVRLVESQIHRED